MAASNAVLAPLTEEPAAIMRKMCRATLVSSSCTGKFSTSRNQFVSDQIDERIRWYMDHFDYAREVVPLDNVVRVDDVVRGCPMNAGTFLQTLEKYLKLYEVA